MNKITKYFLFASGLMLTAGLAHADGEKCDSPMHGQASAQQHGDVFGSVDANGDGAISKAEFDAYYSKHNDKHFKQLDANKDGKISEAELLGSASQEPDSGSATAHLDKRFYAADANHDGGLDKKEASGMPMLTVYFDQVDSNHDGKVTRQEYFEAMPLLHRGKQIDASGKAQTL